MIGLILISHGTMAEGVLDTCRLFFPDGIPQAEALGLEQEDSAEEFEKKIQNAVEKADSGNGVLVLCDLLGGTPANCCRRIAMKTEGKEIQFIAGFNLAVVLEVLGARYTAQNIQELDISQLLETGHQGMVSLNQQLEETEENTEDSFFL